MLWTLIPAKSFHQSKRRLAALFDAEERAAISAALLARTVRVAKTALADSAIVIVASGDDVADVAHAAGADRVIMPRAEGLNPQLAEAALHVPEGADLLILHADLPLLTPQDLAALVATPGPVVLAPDHRGEGTNALLQRAADRFFAFGVGSCVRHREEAARRGLQPSLCARPGLARDLDEADDWAAVEAALGHGTPLSAADLIERLKHPI